MRTAEIHAWVQRVAERTAAEQPNEDMLVELKATWPTPDDAAWRIAGHANAAGGEPILWVIGLDPAGVVKPTRHEELANWWPQVAKHFDDAIAPTYRDVVVELAAGPVVALLFDTEAAPFVIKGGARNHEVPFREGTRVVGARRRHLTRLLAPLARMPTIELIEARLATRYGENEGPNQWGFMLGARLYVVPESGGVYLPRHHQSTAIQVGPYRVEGRPSLSVSSEETGAHDGHAAVAVNAPAFVDLHSFGRVDKAVDDIRDAEVSISVRVEGVDRAIQIRESLTVPAGAPRNDSIFSSHGERRVWVQRR